MSPFVWAQSTNGTMTVRSEGMVVGGGHVGSGNPMNALTVIGEPAGGTARHETCTVRAGSLSFAISRAPGSRTIEVAGQTNEPLASVLVNGIAANRDGVLFRVTDIQLTEGANSISVVAKDLVGNQATQAMTVYLDTRPPARPTMITLPAVTTELSQTLTGTKTPGTSIWINGVELVPRNADTEWTATVRLQEGDNALTVTTKNAAGNESAAHTSRLVVDQLPPVLTVNPPSKTNLTPLILRGSVDDSLTTVHVNGVPALRVGREFESSVPLLDGPNTLVMTATSPNGYVTTITRTVTLGRLPTILTLQPQTGTKVYANVPVEITTTATDVEEDPMEYQILLDGQLLADWHADRTTSWTPTATQRGLHTLEVRVRDGFGGYASNSIDIYVVRQPLSPP